MAEGVTPCLAPFCSPAQILGPNMLSPRNKAKGLVAGEGKRRGQEAEYMATKTQAGQHRGGRHSLSIYHVP